MEYDVGQVLYAVSHKEMKIVPLRVTERIVRQTLDGEKVSYVAQLPDGRTISDLSKLGSDVYTSLDLVREQMLSNVTDIIDSIVSTASDTASNAFNVTTKPSVPKAEEKKEAPETKGGKSKITLPDGTVANVTIPTGI